MAQSSPPNINQNHNATKKQIEDLINANNPDVAKDLCATLCQQRSDDPHAWFLMSAIHAQLGEYADAEQCCLKVIDLAPGLPVVYFNRGLALQQLKRTEEAIVSFRDAIRFQPDFVDAHINLGDALRDVQKAEQACHAYRAAAKLRPDIPAIHTRLAIALRESGDLTGAERSLQQALQIDSKHIPAMLELGRLKIQRRQYPEAIALFREVLSLNRACKEACLQIGGIELIRGNFEAAVESYQKILEFAPEDIGTRLLVTRMLASHGLLKRAEDVCRNGLESSPNAVVLLCELGKVMSEQGRAEEAASCLQQARELDPQNEEVEYLLSSFNQNKDAYVAKQKHIRKMFDGYADSFDSHLRATLEYDIPEQLSRVIGEAAVMARQGLDIMDLGCGTGLCGPLFRNVAGRLVGVDLSSRMLEKARERHVYDELLEADIIDVLQRSANAFDVILAADVFIYVGDVAPVFAGCAQALRAGGLFAFSVESVEGDKYVLRTSGRYGHPLRYIRALAEEHGFDVLVVREAMIRKEGQQPIPGHVVTLMKKPA